MFSSALKSKLLEKIPVQQKRLKELKTEHGNKVLGETTVDQMIGGMRSIPGLLYETSKLDPVEGINYRGVSLEKVCEKSAKVKGGESPLPEGALWLLLTGEFANESEIKDITQDLQQRSDLPQDVEKLMGSLSKDMHPMTQVSIGVLALQTQSKFAKAYSQGTHKSKLWESALEDALDLIAKLPRIAALSYRNIYKDGKISANDKSLDMSANFAQMLGYKEESFNELMRIYLTLHADHEGGNVSAHASHLIGSALSDPYYSFAGALCGLAGPLHGLANQEVLRWLMQFMEKYGKDYTKDNIKDYVEATMKGGQVIPGYGHAVLRKTDPRFTSQQKYAQKYIKNDPLVKLVSDCYDVIPGLLEKTGKIKNPYPNVDAHSGALLWHYGMKEFDYYTVMFGVSRAIGTMSALVWSRALMLPIERPNSNTIDGLFKAVQKK